MKFSEGLDFYWMGLIYIYSDPIYLSSYWENWGKVKKFVWGKILDLWGIDFNSDSPDSLLVCELWVFSFNFCYRCLVAWKTGKWKNLFGVLSFTVFLSLIPKKTENSLTKEKTWFLFFNSTKWSWLFSCKSKRKTFWVSKQPEVAFFS